MSKLRPTLKDAAPGTPCMRNGTAYLLIYNAVKEHDEGLVHGQLHSGDQHCAIGCYFEEHRRTCLPSDLIDEVAAINDSVPGKTPKQRRQFVLSWLHWRLKGLGYLFPGRPRKPAEK